MVYQDRCRIDIEQPMQPYDERWFCVQTQSRKELFAAHNLEKQAYRCFLPIVIKSVKHARKVSKVKAALFPRYLFVNIDVTTQRWRPIRSTFGVSDLVMENERPKPVPRGIVEGLMEAVNDDGQIDFRDTVKVGQEVRLLSGPFYNLVGRLEKLDDRGRVAVLLEILGGERLILTDRTALQPLDA